MPEPAIPPLPDPNTYWLLPGRLLAGEYPGAPDPAAARRKVGAFVAAGVDTFIDLTEPGELIPYALLLPAGAEHHRLPIRDLGVPDDPRHMQAILDAIDTALAAGRGVYVHCWGGVGRTGTVVACWLQRRGRSPEAALAELAGHWKTVGKFHRTPRSPETDGQRAWVHRWPQTLAALAASEAGQKP